MLTVPLAAVSVVAAINSAISTEVGSRRAETGDDFAALLGLQVAGAAGETKPEPATARPALPKGGKALPVASDVTPEILEPTSPELSACDDRPTSSQPELLTLPDRLFALTAPVSNAPVAAQPVAAFAPPPAATANDLPVPLAPKGAKPTNVAIRPDSEARLSQPKFQPAGDATRPNAATEVTTVPDDDATGKPAPARPKLRMLSGAKLNLVPSVLSRVVGSVPVYTTSAPLATLTLPAGKAVLVVKHTLPIAP